MYKSNQLFPERPAECPCLMQTAAGTQASPQNTFLPCQLSWDHPDDWREFTLQACSDFGISERPFRRMADTSPGVGFMVWLPLRMD